MATSPVTKSLLSSYTRVPADAAAIDRLFARDVVAGHWTSIDSVVLAVATIFPWSGREIGLHL
jgi:hypothetical protein